MKQYRFEIVRRGNDRFYWLFVVVKRSGRRVLARSARDYGSPRKVRGAIETLQSVDVDTTEDPFTLPATSFRIVPGVVPLMVEEFPVEDRSDEAHEFHVFLGARNDSPGKPTGEQAAANAAAEPSATRARKPAARRASRAKKAA